MDTITNMTMYDPARIVFGVVFIVMAFMFGVMYLYITSYKNHWKEEMP